MVEHKLVIVTHRGRWMGKDVFGIQCEQRCQRREAIFAICYSCFALYTNISVTGSCMLCQFM